MSRTSLPVNAARRQAAAELVDALVVRQFAADADRRLNLTANHAFDVQHDQAVVQQQRITSFDFAREILVIEAGAVFTAERCAGIKNEFLPRAAV